MTGVWVIEEDGRYRAKVVVGSFTTYSILTWSDASEASRVGSRMLATAMLRVGMGAGL